MIRPALLPLVRRAARLASCETAAASVWSIFWLTMMMMISGFTLDVSNAYRVRALLQATADASALAAVRALPDAEAARAAAINLSRVNMPVSGNGTVVLPAMVQIGAWDAETNSFASGATPYDAVKVTAARGNGAGLEVPTFLVGLLGRDSWQVAASSTARTRSGSGGQARNVCHGALILGGDAIDTGGGNTLTEGVCLHGEAGVHFGGSDWFDSDVRVSAADIDDIYIGHVRPGSAPGSEVKQEQSLAPAVVPQLDTMFSQLWNTLYHSGASTYSGDLLPDYVRNPATGSARIVRINQWWWTAQPGDLEPYTIYLVNHGMQLAGGVDFQNGALIANGQIGVGGGPDLHFDKVFIFGADTLNFSGNIQYGNPNTYCDDGKFDVYLFSKNTISLGGWSASAWVYGLMAAAPTFSPGGSLKNAGGLYVEATNSMQLGGNMQIAGCGTALEADYEIVEVTEGTPSIIGGALVQ